jgi:hypothetical protein
MNCDSCGLPVYWMFQECQPVAGSCRECGAGICARPDCAAEPAEVCCDECGAHGLCWDCASLAWCPELPTAILEANRLAVEAETAAYNARMAAGQVAA